MNAWTDIKSISRQPNDLAEIHWNGNLISTTNECCTKYLANIYVGIINSTRHTDESNEEAKTKINKIYLFGRLSNIHLHL